MDVSASNPFKYPLGIINSLHMDEHDNDGWESAVGPATMQPIAHTTEKTPLSILQTQFRHAQHENGNLKAKNTRLEEENKALRATVGAQDALIERLQERVAKVTAKHLLTEQEKHLAEIEARNVQINLDGARQELLRYRNAMLQPHPGMYFGGPVYMPAPPRAVVYHVPSGMSNGRFRRDAGRRSGNQ